MKTDIIEGRLLVTPEKAVLLASYGLQVELGDHDDNVHTVQSLQNFTLLPKHMTRSAEILEDFVRQVVLAYKSLRGLPPAEAELLYIAETRQCEGYGEEYFQARDEDGNEAFVGYCLEGIIVKRLQGVPIKYRWEEITRASWHKRTLSVNFREVSSIAFTMEDCETCKYATAIFNLQLEFFKDVSWRNQTGHRNGYYEMRSSFASVQKGNNRSNEAVVKKITLFNDSGASAIGNVNLNNGACEKIVNQQGFICDYLDLEQTENGQQGTDLSCFKTGVTNQNGKLPTCSSWSEYDSALDNLRQLSYSTPHILPSSICGINVSQSSLAEQNGSLLEKTAPATPPPYQPAPDYDSALKQPSLDEYRMALCRQALAEKRARYLGSPQGIIQLLRHLGYSLSTVRILMDNGEYVFLSPEVAAVNSNPELNNRSHHHHQGGYSPGNFPTGKQLFSTNHHHLGQNNMLMNGYIVNGRVFASTPDLAGIDRMKLSKSSPELSYRPSPFLDGNLGITHKLRDSCNKIRNKLQTRLDVTLENLTELSEVGVTPTSGTSFRPSTKVFDDVDEVFTQAPAHASCSSSSTVSSSRRSSVQPQVTLGKQLPEFEDKGMENKKDSTALSVATSTVYNGGLCVVRPDLIQGNEVSDISNDERLADMCCRLKEGFLTEEFDKIPRKRVSAGVSTSQKAENQKRNRYANILPYEDTRIMLRPNKTNTSGYVNASNIQEGGIEKSCQYWPMEGDGKTKLKFGDFQVSLQSSTVSKTQVTCCLQLKHTPSSSRRVVYHLQYLDWPTGEVPASVDSFLAFLDEVSSVKRHLENEQQKNLENVYSRSRSQSRSSLFDISNQSTGSWKRSIPGPSCSLGFLPARDRERSLSDATSSPLSVALSGSLSGATMGSLESPPVVVHCCSGAGRTGVYILTELMVYCLEHNHNMDISKMLALLRQQRMHLVQTMAQYKFVYTCLVDYLRNSRLI